MASSPSAQPGPKHLTQPRSHSGQSRSRGLAGDRQALTALRERMRRSLLCDGIVSTRMRVDNKQCRLEYACGNAASANHLNANTSTDDRRPNPAHPPAPRL